MSASLAPRQVLRRRWFAKSVDVFIVIALGVVLPRFIGPLLGFAYSLFADALPQGLTGNRGSFGKRLVGLGVVNRKERRPITLTESVIRNSPVGVATFFAIIPIVGWIILFVVGVPLLAMEVYLMLRKDGLRLGDVMADTEVVQAAKKNAHERKEPALPR